MQEVVSHKHLGVNLSQRCDWQTQIEFFKEKAWSLLNLHQMLKLKTNLKSLQTIYFAYIVLYYNMLISYGTPVHSNSVMELKNPNRSWTYCHWCHETCRN